MAKRRSTITKEHDADNVCAPLLDAKRSDNVDIRDQVIATLLDEKRSTPLVMDNYDAMQRLTANFAKYIEEQKIPVAPALLSQLVNRSAQEKLAFVKTRLCPRVDELDQLVRQGCKAEGIELTEEKVAKCVRFLRAMIEVAAA